MALVAALLIAFLVGVIALILVVTRRSGIPVITASDEDPFDYPLQERSRSLYLKDGSRDVSDQVQPQIVPAVGSDETSGPDYYVKPMHNTSGDLKAGSSANVLIIDSDLGFLWWLGQALHERHFRAVPAKNVFDAVYLIRHFRLAVDLLVIDPSAVRIAPFIEGRRRSNENLKVIAAASTSEASVLPGVDASMDKPATGNNIAKSEWLQVVQNVIGTTSVPRSKAGNPPLSHRRTSGGLP